MNVLFRRRQLLVVIVSILFAGVNPSHAQEQERRIQAVMRCQKLEERFTPGRDLGAQTVFKMGAGSQLTSIVRQRLEVAATRAIGQLFSWNEVEQDYIKVYAETCSPDQLDFIFELCRHPHYQQLMQLEILMTKDTLALNENYIFQIQQAALKAVQDVL
ncbi:hypothetical protein [Synechococcus sp. BIOS-E4-1]|uniref:hypothetical protein n=1 Tax=Synechococcus sp. BIOS-E4-1 TaxID=1400864 RepID=UPI001647D0B3|nr:hypothetical protein [Synechococcus sp. BIOS-E4-1]